ncbi:recombinase family protein, partial [Mariprofundus sp. EBB-1]|uniref:recombinase family protein n=1 Tax=Mariprofundus sp. EBB-1 TaxID=2650971 RepID=UPI000F1FD304
MVVALYARVSTVRQAEKDLSIPDQIRQMEDWCKAKGYKVGVKYVEAGASGTDAKRPAFQRMITDATLSPPPFDAIIIHSLSRFFRDSLEFGLYERKLNKIGVKLISITQQTSDDPSGEMARKIFSIFDEYSSKENGKHTLRAMNENARQGFFNGSRPPFGYQTIDSEIKGRHGYKKRLAINPTEASIVKQIYKLYLNGHNGKSLGMKGIANHFTERGISMRGKPWRIQKIQDILSSKTYTGEYYFNQTDSKTKKKKPKSEWIRLDIESIIEAETFRSTEELRDARSHERVPPRMVNNPTLLTGILKCGCCGSGMTLATGKGGKYKYYKCTTRINKGNAHCSSKNIPMDKLDEIVLGRLVKCVFTPERINIIADNLRSSSKKSNEQTDQQLQLFQQELKAIDAKMDRLYEAVESGFLPMDETLQVRAEKLRVRRQDVLIELSSIRRISQTPFSTISKRHIEAFSKALRSRLVTNNDFSKGYLKLLVNKITVNEEEAIIEGDSKV